MSAGGAAAQPNRIDWYHLLGPIAVFFSAVIMAVYFLLDPNKIGNHVPDFLVLTTVASTVIYSFLFLIAPELQRSRGLSGAGTALLVIALILASAVSLLLLYMYIDRTFFSEFSDCAFQCRTRVLVGFALQPWFSFFGKDANATSEAAKWLLDKIETFHFLLFVGIFSAIDLIFYCFSPDASEKQKFRSILCFIDAPMLVAVLVIMWLIAYPFASKAQQSSGEVLEAGAMTFQFISGLFAAYVVQNEATLGRLLLATAGLASTIVTTAVGWLGSAVSWLMSFF